MASLPYVTAPGNVAKALAGIKSAAVPERVSQDFVKNILKIPGGSGDQMTTFLKKIGFVASDGKPTDLYTRYRNPARAGGAVAEAIKRAYAPLYLRNEYVHTLSERELTGLVVEETGQPGDSSPVRNIVSCIKALRALADFSGDNGASDSQAVEVTQRVPTNEPMNEAMRHGRGIGLNLGYTININLPATADQAVFNAIFKSIKQNLLTDDDA